MDKIQISRDDLQDVQELAEKLINSWAQAFEDHDRNITYSALVSATVSLIVGISRNFGELLYNKKIFDSFFEEAINAIEHKMINPKQDPKKDPDQVA